MLLFRKGEICVTVGQLKRVAPCDTRGHDRAGFNSLKLMFLISILKAIKLKYTHY